MKKTTKNTVRNYIQLYADNMLNFITDNIINYDD